MSSIVFKVFILHHQPTFATASLVLPFVAFASLLDS